MTYKCVMIIILIFLGFTHSYKTYTDFAIKFNCVTQEVHQINSTMMVKKDPQNNVVINQGSFLALIDNNDNHCSDPRIGIGIKLAQSLNTHDAQTPDQGILWNSCVICSRDHLMGVYHCKSGDDHLFFFSRQVINETPIKLIGQNPLWYLLSFVVPNKSPQTGFYFEVLKLCDTNILI